MVAVRMPFLLGVSASPSTATSFTAVAGAAADVLARKPPTLMSKEDKKSFIFAVIYCWSFS